MRVVITGATGNVGTSLVSVLGDEPAVTSVVGLARRLPDWDAPKTTWRAADVARDDLVAHFDGADAVVHLAWIFQPTRDPERTWRNNVLGSIRVFDAVAAAQVPTLVYASSVGAYSPAADDAPVDESWPTHALPTAAYGREKSYVERVLDAFELRHPDIRVVRLRPGFIFKRESAAEQRRLFAGPLLPSSLVRPVLIPVVPDAPALRFQALHSEDAANAYRLAAVSGVRGAFNIAADPVVDPSVLGELLGARPVKVPHKALRLAAAAAWRLRLSPASPMLVDLAASLPTMDLARARIELGWEPARTSVDAIAEFLDGLRHEDGMATPPLNEDAGGPARVKEFATGVGAADVRDSEVGAPDPEAQSAPDPSAGEEPAEGVPTEPTPEMPGGGGGHTGGGGGGDTGVTGASGPGRPGYEGEVQVGEDASPGPLEAHRDPFGRPEEAPEAPHEIPPEIRAKLEEIDGRLEQDPGAGPD